MIKNRNKLKLFLNFLITMVIFNMCLLWPQKPQIRSLQFPKNKYNVALHGLNPHLYKERSLSFQNSSPPPPPPPPKKKGGGGGGQIFPIKKRVGKIGCSKKDIIYFHSNLPFLMTSFYVCVVYVFVVSSITQLLSVFLCYTKETSLIESNQHKCDFCTWVILKSKDIVDFCKINF